MMKKILILLVGIISYLPLCASKEAESSALSSSYIIGFFNNKIYLQKEQQKLASNVQAAAATPEHIIVDAADKQKLVVQFIDQAGQSNPLTDLDERITKMIAVAKQAMLKKYKEDECANGQEDGKAPVQLCSSFWRIKDGKPSMIQFSWGWSIKRNAQLLSDPAQMKPMEEVQLGSFLRHNGAAPVAFHKQ